MNRSYLLTRVFEVLITITSSYLALISFFNSSLYQSISEGVSRFLAAYSITTSVAAQAEQLIPLMVTAMVFLVVMYNYAAGKPEYMVEIFQLNMVFYMPEALSFSKLNWLNLINQPQILQPSRGFHEVLLTGILITTGYLALHLTAKHRETLKELENRGADPGQIDEVFIHQTTLSFSLSVLAALTTLVMAFSIPLIRDAMTSSLSLYKERYLVLGVASSTLILGGIALYLKSRAQASIE